MGSRNIRLIRWEMCQSSGKPRPTNISTIFAIFPRIYLGIGVSRISTRPEHPLFRMTARVTCFRPRFRPNKHARPIYPLPLPSSSRCYVGKPWKPSLSWVFPLSDSKISGVTRRVRVWTRRQRGERKSSISGLVDFLWSSFLALPFRPFKSETFQNLSNILLRFAKQFIFSPVSGIPFGHIKH